MPSRSNNSKDVQLAIVVKGRKHQWRARIIAQKK